MKICPVAIAVGCRKCPVFDMCPAKGVIGDYQKPKAAAKDRVIVDEPPAPKHG